MANRIIDGWGQRILPIPAVFIVGPRIRDIRIDRCIIPLHLPTARNHDGIPIGRIIIIILEVHNCIRRLVHNFELPIVSIQKHVIVRCLSVSRKGFFFCVIRNKVAALRFSIFLIYLCSGEATVPLHCFCGVIPVLSVKLRIDWRPCHCRCLC